MRLTGLTACPDLNGIRGIVIGFDRDKDRWRVDVGNGPLQLLKGENLRPESASGSHTSSAPPSASGLPSSGAISGGGEAGSDPSDDTLELLEDGYVPRAHRG